MEVIKEEKSSSGYGKPPWVFRGSALYQIHLVKAETARAFIPKEFKLVEAFGYTLGGFFLASYDDSPAGIFDELVVIAGIVWNPPTSCAWAARVLVNSHEACLHGRKYVGLPSQVAKFSKGYFLSYCLGSSYFHKVAHGSRCPIIGLPERVKAIPRQSKSKTNGFLNMIGIGTTSNNVKDCMDIQVGEIKGPVVTDICTINVGTTAVARAVPVVNSNKLMGPVIKMSLPSFSGRTEYNPHLLKYSIRIECRIRAVQPAKMSGPSMAPKDDTEQSFRDSITRDIEEDQRNLSISVMLSKPILALEFNCLKMQVEAPTIVSPSSKNALKGS